MILRMTPRVLTKIIRQLKEPTVRNPSRITYFLYTGLGRAMHKAIDTNTSAATCMATIGIVGAFYSK